VGVRFPPPKGSPVLVELGLLEQRHKAVLEALKRATVTDAPRRYGGGPPDPARLAATL
jgi:hypothetical protein